MTGVVVRFAPSPTGRLHPGNARTALLNAHFARGLEGRFVLRIDDTDPSREEAGAVDAIRSDLNWLGIPPDAEARQAPRAARYEVAAADLLRRGRAYRDDGAVRLHLADIAGAWNDLVHGPMRIELAHQNDPVLVRQDGRATYLLASVVDDVDLGVTHVIRRADHLTNTAVQLELFAAVGAAAPAFAHLPLVVDATGAPLSKRDSALSLAALRDNGVEPEPISAYLLSIGTGHDLDASVAPTTGVDLAAFGRAPTVFDAEAVVRAQDRWVASLDAAEANRRLAARGCAPAAPALWTAVRGNLQGHGDAPWGRIARLAEFERWRTTFEMPQAFTIDDEDRAYLARAAELLRGAEDVEAWLQQVTAATGRKGRRLRLPLRRALTGRPDGPPLSDLVALLGPERTRRRLRGEAA